jgi:hypothetical protein
LYPLSKFMTKISRIEQIVVHDPCTCAFREQKNPQPLK